MKVFLVGSMEHEKERQENILSLQSGFKNLEIIAPVYPNQKRVPFQENIFNLSYKRTGHRITMGELGCLLSHRKIWSSIQKKACSDKEGFLIVESDSLIKDLHFLKDQFDNIHERYDMFFWGAFDNRMQLLRSKCYKVSDKYDIGIPLINSLYCTYGYSVNKKAAAFLLKDTGNVNYPCDYWKRRLKKTNLRIGGITPCIIETDKRFRSQIQVKDQHKLFYFLRDKIVDFKNKVICSVS